MQIRVGLGAVFAVAFLHTAIFAQVSPRPLVTRLVDESRLVTLKGNVHPLARPEFDIGTAQPDLPLRRMLLVLKRSPEQEFALRKLLDDQQDKASSNYHKWLTPDEFGAQFGPADQDISAVTNWLQSHGLQVGHVSHGKTVIEFSGSESQLEEALHTQIHKYLVEGEEHSANASDPQIPEALAPIVAGVRALNNFRPSRLSRLAGAFTRNKADGKVIPAPGSKPLLTFPAGGCGVQPENCYAVGPWDFATIYDSLPAWNSSPAIDGTGETIAIVGETDINLQDVADFRNFFGLPAYNQTGGPTLKVIHDGPAPGILTDGEESESDLDVEWSGAVAKGANVDFVVGESTETTFGIDLSALRIVDENLAPVMSESYGICELFIGTAGNQFYSAMWQQAAAQGITVMLSSGDGSSAGCDNFDRLGPATHGLAVSGFSSTPYNVSVGGTDFNDLTDALTFWNTSNAATTQASALSYIPETTWDDNCTNPVFGNLLGFSNNAETNCNNGQLINFGFVNIIGGSGGKSSCISSDGVNASSCAKGYPKPSWQNAPGVPADGARDVPDVSLFAASGSPSGSFYIICEADLVGGSSCDPNNPATGFLGIGGTSASSPAFAGIMALVNQQQQSRQGNANFVLYNLARNAPTSFHDVTTGTIRVPCQTNSKDCKTSRSGDQFGILNGYDTAVGYDLATGIGSVDVNQLLQNWNLAKFTATTTILHLSLTTNITHGQAVNVTGSVAPSSGSGTPTGAISLLTSTGQGIDGFNLNGGALSGTTNLLPGGTYTVTAHYAGDPTFASSDSQPVSVVVGKENSEPQLQLITTDLNGNVINNNATTVVYGSPYFVRVNVLNSSNALCQPNPLGEVGCPTGNVTLTDNGNALGAPFALNSEGYAEDFTVQFPGGSNAVTTHYSGDNSFNTSSTTATLKVTPAPTTISTNFFGGTVGNNISSNVTVQAQSSGAVPSGTVTFFANGNPIPGTVTYSTFPNETNNPPAQALFASFISSSSPFPAPGNYTLTASYSGDANYQPSNSSGATFFVQFATPFVDLQASPNVVNAGSSTSLLATVAGASPTIAPTGTISFFGTNSGNLPGTVTYKTVKDPNTGNLDLQGTLKITPAFTDGYSGSYTGDSNYPPDGACCTVVVTVNGNDFVFSAKQSSASVSPGGSASYPLLVGFQSNTAPVSFTCSGLPSEASCNISPNPDASTISVNLGISTTAPNSATKTSIHSSQFLWFSSTLPFAAILFIGYKRNGTRCLLSRTVLTCLLLVGVACGGGSSGGGSGGGGTPPAPPTSLTASAISSSKINLGWFPSNDATSYAVYRSTTTPFTPSSSNQIANTNESSFYADSGLTPSTTYYYQLKAANSSGLSVASNQASASTQAFDPGTPAGTYNITVTATSGPISHNVNLTLVVQ